jgi:hypothetical protein
VLAADVDGRRLVLADQDRREPRSPPVLGLELGDAGGDLLPDGGGDRPAVDDPGAQNPSLTSVDARSLSQSGEDGWGAGRPCVRRMSRCGCVI